MQGKFDSISMNSLGKCLFKCNAHFSLSGKLKRMV